jgi:hypothetical protein
MQKPFLVKHLAKELRWKRALLALQMSLILQAVYLVSHPAANSLSTKIAQHCQ